MTLTAIPAIASAPSRIEREAMALSIRQLVGILMTRRESLGGASAVAGTVLLPTNSGHLASNPKGECAIHITDARFQGVPTSTCLTPLLRNEGTIDAFIDEMSVVDREFGLFAAWCAWGVSDFNMYSPSHADQVAFASISFGSGHYAQVAWTKEGNIVGCRSSVANLGSPASSEPLKRLKVSGSEITDDMSSAEQLSVFFDRLTSSIKSLS